MKKFIPGFLLLACVALIGGTFYFLLRDRFEAGDVYPPASSLRSDPLGTLILFESLQALPGLTVTRDHSAINRLPAGQRTVYLHFAGESFDWRTVSTKLAAEIDWFLLEGGRLIITFKPEYGPREDSSDSVAARKKDDAEKKELVPAASPQASPKESTQSNRDFVDLEEKWGLEFFKAKRGTGKREVRNVSNKSLPTKLEWNGDTVLKNASADWLILYEDDKGPVLAEKKRGLGSVVIATDSYFVSNEALVQDRHPELLAWLIGSADQVVFDEAHLGVMDTPGIAALARKYRLHGGVMAVLILAGLFIWKNAVPLVPARGGIGRNAEVVAGRSAGAGFVNLLKRSIPADQIFNVCLEEWQKSFHHGNRRSVSEKVAVEEVARAEAARPTRDRDPVAAYQKIRTALKRTLI